jgi:leader peptidase (prepilin peptidase)/N-methyltransferase
VAVAAVAAFIGGMLIGSFLTVVAHRVPRGESVVAGRSHCPGCGAQIAAYDNVPVISWVALRGRARCCGMRISPRYPLTELATAILFAATVIVLWNDAGEIAIGLVFIAMLVAITLTDLEQQIIPNRILAPAAIVGLALVVATDPSSIPERAISAAAAGGVLFVAALAYPRGMGLGDVKLAAVMGLFLGRNVAAALLMALLAGSVVGFAIIAREGSDARKRAIPFGPFLALGGVVGLLAGDPMVEWYLNTFT